MVFLVPFCRSRIALLACLLVSVCAWLHPIMLHDAARAVRLVRARAADWNVDPNRIGIMGSSAGGHLASTLLTHFDCLFWLKAQGFVR